MLDFNDFVRAVQEVSSRTADSKKPANVVFGKVISVSPLKIQLEQKVILSSAQLVLSRAVTDYSLEMAVDHETEPDDTGGTHVHAYKGRKTFTVHNGLKTGEQVILLQALGGQQYVVLDRIGKG